MKDVLFSVAYNKELATGIHEIRLCAEEPLPAMHCGQFLHMEAPGVPTVLRRPFCLYKFDDRSVTIVVAAVGKGSAAVCAMKPGDRARAIVPIGNGYRLEPQHKRVALIGGGVGCAPLVSVGKCYPDVEFKTFIGFPDRASIFFREDFAAFSDVTVCTDDGSAGFKGFPTDAFERSGFKADVILTCGPMSMVKAVARISAQTRIPAYMSGESHMGCGVGACLVCVCALRNADGTVSNKRACVDGPVFKVEDLVL